MFPFEVRQGKLKVLNFFPGKCFLTVKNLGEQIHEKAVSAVPGLDFFCLCKGAGS